MACFQWVGGSAKKAKCRSLHYTTDDETVRCFGRDGDFEGLREIFLHLCEVVHDVGVGPVLGVDELSAEDALLVDDVGFGDLFGAVEAVDPLLLVADGDQIDVMLDQKLVVEVGVLIDADGDDFEVGHLLVQFEQAGQLLDAWGAPGGPEVEHNDVAAQLAEIDAVGSVGDSELWCGFADVSGVAAPVAACYQKQTQYETRPDFMHFTLQFL